MESQPRPPAAFELADADLLAECRFEAFRGPGPGGQHRNKTSSAVRVTHTPTGLSATAGESRSQHRNKAAALDRLRHRLALECPPPDGDALPPNWFADRVRDGGRLRIGRRDGDYLRAVAVVSAAVAAAGGSVSAAAGRLGLTTANLVDFLQRDEKLLARVNRVRQSAGLKALGGAP